MRAAIQTLLRQALALHEAGRRVEAESLYAQVRQAEPKNFDVIHLSGFLALQEGRVADGVLLLQRAEALNSRHALCSLRLAHGLKLLGRLSEARLAAQRAAVLDASCVDAHFLLGELISRIEGFAASIAHFRRVTELQPAAPDGWANLGLALTQSQKAIEALACFDRALTLDPENEPALTGRALALQESHRIAEAVAAYEVVLRKNPKNHEARSARLLALHYLDGVTREELFAEHRGFGATFGSQPAQHFAPSLDADRRLRVAFISPDFRRHSVAHFIEPLLANLDRSQFEVVLYHDHAVVDETSQRLRELASEWRHIAGQPNAIVEAAIRSDAPDLLIDLAGHTGFNRLPLLAHRLAPVQATYLGYPDTTGLPAIDFRLTDELADPVGEADAFATEQLVRFSPCAWTYAPPAEAPEVAAPPSLVNRHVTFGCFNNFAKVSDATVRGWSQILAALPNSRLLLKNHGLDHPAFAATVAKRFEALGVNPLRLELLGRTAGTAAHLSIYGRIDVALDTFPYHGTTTTCEALWQGRPVVTLAGDRHASRVGSSLLTAAGHREWVARTWDEYVQIAVGLAQNFELRTDLSQNLRETLAGSILCDPATQSAHFGAALRGMWQAWCRREASEERCA